jgi:predicted transcriptional regulator
MSAKEVLLEVAEKLPPDATLVDAIYELEFRQAVEEGLAELDQGKRIPLEEARKRIPQWISKYSSPRHACGKVSTALDSCYEQSANP